MNAHINHSLKNIAKHIPDNPEERLTPEMRRLLLSGKYRFDMHTHIFNRDYIPDKYFGIRIPFMVNAEFLEYVESMLDEVDTLEEDKLRYYAYFIDFASKNSMEQIVKYLINNSASNTIFAAIAMDFVTSIDDKVKKGYKEQIRDLSKVRDKYPDIILPFLEINPNNPDAIHIFKEAFTKLGFFGIKVYPSLGYLPSHPLLMEIFEICEQKNIPVIAHCGVGQVHTSQNFPEIKYVEIDENGKWHIRKQKKMFFFKNQFVKFFNKPQNWETVLRAFPNLRLNFAHMGGEDDWDGVAKTDRQWTLRIFDFMERYPNVYADVSYILHRKEMPSLFRECYNNNDIVKERALYGTDFYMITTEGKFKEMRMRFISEVGSEIMKVISVENPVRFLGLENLLKNGENNKQDS